MQISCYQAVFSALLVVAGMSGCGSPVRQPSEVVGTWHTDPGVTLTFEADGKLSLDGKGTVPSFFAGLANASYWECRHGNIYVFARGPDDMHPSFESQFSSTENGQVLEIGVYRFKRK